MCRGSSSYGTNPASFRVSVHEMDIDATQTDDVISQQQVFEKLKRQVFMYCLL